MEFAEQREKAFDADEHLRAQLLTETYGVTLGVVFSSDWPDEREPETSYEESDWVRPMTELPVLRTDLAELESRYPHKVAAAAAASRVFGKVPNIPNQRNPGKKPR